MQENNQEEKEEQMEEDKVEQTPEDQVEASENATEENQTEEKEQESSFEAIAQADEVSQLKQQLDDANQALLRERADFINFRKRSTQEKADMQVRLTGELLDSMLPAMDAFDQLFVMREKSSQEQAKVSVEKFFEGIDLIYNQLWGVFAEMDFEKIDALDQEFDPNVMEAIGVEEREGIEFETVVQVYQQGYKNKGRVLRPARVMVAKPKAGEAKSQ